MLTTSVTSKEHILTDWKEEGGRREKGWREGEEEDEEGGGRRREEWREREGKKRWREKYYFITMKNFHVLGCS